MNDNNTPILNKEYLKKNNILWKYFIHEYNGILNICLWKFKINHAKISTIVFANEYQYYKINCTTIKEYQYNTIFTISMKTLNCNRKPYIITTNTDTLEIGFTTTPKELMKLIKERFIKIIKKEHKQNNKLYIIKCYKQIYKQIINEFKIKGLLAIKINII